LAGYCTPVAGSVNATSGLSGLPSRMNMAIRSVLIG
jgi:hypothetical protein